VELAVLSLAPGLALGSFLNVVAARVPRRVSIVSPASACMDCGTAIAWRDNIPVVSWLLLRGRCRHCGEPIAPRYPLIELLTAAVFVAVALVRGVDMELLVQLPLAAVLIAVAAIDLEHRIVPNRLVAPAAAWALVGGVAIDAAGLPELLAAGGGAFAGMLLVALAYPAGMGMGDVKLAGAMGLFLGLSVVPAMLVAFLSGTVVGLGIMAREGAQARKKAVPFGVFLALGGLVGVLAGPELIELYEDRFLA
jgi:leader peptidase (prepilin peptidase) / N-methyltransferase